MKKAIIIVSIILAIIGLVATTIFLIQMIGPGSEQVIYEVGYTVESSTGIITLNEVEILPTLDGYTGDATGKEFVVCSVTFNGFNDYAINANQFDIDGTYANMEASQLKNNGTDYLSDYVLTSAETTFYVVFVVDSFDSGNFINILFATYLY